MNIASNKELKYIQIDKVVANRYQPRVVFNQEALQELAQSINENGLIQPITVRPIVNGLYEIVAGERRFKAACLAGYQEVPCIIQDYTDEQLAEVALVENIQREDLSAIEEAEAYKKLIELTGCTQSELAIKVGKKQSTIANKIRLLQLPKDIQTTLKEKKITERHARALLSLNDENEMIHTVDKILNDNLTVKDTEELVSHSKNKQSIKKEKPKRAVNRGITKDVRIATNTIKQAVEMIRKTGIDIEYFEEDQDENYRIILEIIKK